MDDAYGGKVRKRRLERTRGQVVFSLQDLSDRLGRRPGAEDVEELLPEEDAVLERLLAAPPEGDRRQGMIWGHLTSIAAKRAEGLVSVPRGDYAGLELVAGRIEVAGGEHLGEGMRGGEVVVRGRAGDYLGQGMKGGGIVADACGDYAFRNMEGGWGVVLEDAGNYLGLGNKGGRLVVKGHAGQRAGWLMHSGRIHVGEDAGDYLGMMMSGGRITVRGNAGARAGWRMRGGILSAGGYGPEAGEGARGELRAKDP